jgi:hypothetical protein
MDRDFAKFDARLVRPTMTTRHDNTSRPRRLLHNYRRCTVIYVEFHFAPPLRHWSQIYIHSLYSVDMLDAHRFLCTLIAVFYSSYSALGSLDFAYILRLRPGIFESLDCFDAAYSHSRATLRAVTVSAASHFMTAADLLPAYYARSAIEILPTPIFRCRAYFICISSARYIISISFILILLISAFRLNIFDIFTAEYRSLPLNYTCH